MKRITPYLAPGLLVIGGACGYEEPATLDKDAPATIVDVEFSDSEYNPTTFSADYTVGYLLVKQCLPNCNEFEIKLTDEELRGFEDAIGTEVTPSELND